VDLGDVQSINASLSGGPPPVFGRGAFAVEEAMAASDVPISPGQMEISVDVHVVYEIQ
jgi:uncharacterized protein YggE